MPKADKLIAVAKELGVSPLYLLDGDEGEDAPTAEEMKMISLFRTLDSRGQEIVNAVLMAESKQMLLQTMAPQLPVGTKIIPLFGTAAAAGPGEPDTNLPWEEYEVPDYSPAEFAIRISGDSMEPELPDGSVALCIRRRPSVGDLTIMSVNGFLLVKQFIKDFYGNVYLRSINRQRKDCDYDIMASGNDTVMCFGIVLVDHKIPLAE